jgi:hypothetical protein
LFFLPRQQHVSNLEINLSQHPYYPLFIKQIVNQNHPEYQKTVATIFLAQVTARHSGKVVTPYFGVLILKQNNNESFKKSTEILVKEG